MNAPRHWMKWTARSARIACSLALGLLVLTGSTRAGLINHWPFEEGSGTTTADVVGGQNAELLPNSNPPVWITTDLAPVPSGTTAALEFDNNNDRVVATDYKGISGTNPRSVSAWIKTTEIDNEGIIAWGVNNSGEKWVMRVQDDNGPVDGALRVENNGGRQVGTTMVADGQWHHVAATWEDDGVSPNVNDVRLWVDGELEDISNSSGQAVNTSGGDPTAGVDVRIGRGIPNSQWFGGQIDDVRIYDHAMSRNEIRALAGLAPDPYYEAVKANNPIGYWRLGEATADKAFNEGSLGAAIDGSYTADPPTAVGQPSLVPAITNTAALFDSDDDKVNIPDNDGLNTGAGPYPQRSIEAWFAVADNTRNRMVIYEEGGTSSGFNMYVAHANDDTHYLRYGAWTDLTGSQQNHFPDRVEIALDEGYHAVSVFDATNEDFFVYVNGAPAGGKLNSNVEPIDQHGGDVAIGAKRGGTRYDTANDTGGSGGSSSGGPGNWFAGTIDEVAVYDTAVDLRSIQTHYVAGVGTPMALGLRPGTTLGVVLNYDASFDSDGNATWEDTIGSRPFQDGQVAQTNQFDFDLTGVTRVTVDSDALPKLTHAYEFDGAASATAREVDDVAGEPTRFSASFELAFKPSDFQGNEILFDLGGNTDGSALWLEDSVLHFDVKDNAVNARPQFDLASLSATEQNEFFHVIGVADLDNDEALLYVNGILRDVAAANGDLNDWAGGNDLGLGSIGGNMAFAEQDPFVGQIALARIYGGAGAGLLSAADVAANFDALRVPEPSSFVLAGLALLGLVWCGRRRRR